MGMINYGGYCKIYGTDYKSIQKTKIRVKDNCSMCREEIPSGSVCVGKDYSRYCLKCYPKLFKNIKDEIKRFENMMSETENDIKSNKEKYETNNMACKI